MPKRLALSMLLASVILAPVTTRGADLRSVALVVTDEQGAFVPDVRREEVLVLENGEPREITSFQRDERPLAVALVIDASDGALKVFRVHAPGAVEAFLARLPAGAHTTLWTTGERSRKLGELTGSKEVVEKKVAQGFGVGGTNASSTRPTRSAASPAGAGPWSPCRASGRGTRPGRRATCPRGCCGRGRASSV
jgi:hypothetical protein